MNSALSNMYFETCFDKEKNCFHAAKFCFEQSFSPIAVLCTVFPRVARPQTINCEHSKFVFNQGLMVLRCVDQTSCL